MAAGNVLKQKCLGISKFKKDLGKKEKKEIEAIQ